MIDLAILGLLKEQEFHGYELKKQLGELTGARSSVSFGSLYPALARLEKAGAVKAVEANVAARPAMPMTGALSGEIAAFRQRVTEPIRGRRGKKVYGITEVGERRLTELLTNPEVDDRTFRLQVAFCRHVSAADRLALFQRRRAELAARLDDRRRARKAGGQPPRQADRYLRALREHDTESITHDLTWLDGLIAEEQDSTEAAASPTGGESP